MKKYLLRKDSKNITPLLIDPKKDAKNLITDSSGKYDFEIIEKQTNSRVYNMCKRGNKKVIAKIELNFNYEPSLHNLNENLELKEINGPGLK